jgi:predicted GIY-YIG superfamily endonuclease
VHTLQFDRTRLPRCTQRPPMHTGSEVTVSSRALPFFAEPFVARRTIRSTCERCSAEGTPAESESDAHLENSPDCEDVVYILRCAPQVMGGAFTWYVGRSSRPKLARRMRQHASGSAADFTAKNKPIYLEGLYPAARESVEAYAFFSMMDTLPVNALASGRLGGWTQTRPRPSLLCVLLLQEQKRMLSDSCLACGSSDHYVKDHPPNVSRDAAPIACENCSAIIKVTALGSCTTQPDPSLVRSAL